MAVEVRKTPQLGDGEVGLFAQRDLAPHTFVCYFGGELVPDATATGRHLYSVEQHPLMIDGAAVRQMPITHAGALVNSSAHNYGARNVASFVRACDEDGRPGVDHNRRRLGLDHPELDQDHPELGQNAAEGNGLRRRRRSREPFGVVHLQC